MSTALDRETFLQRNNTAGKLLKLDLPELDGHVFIRQISGHERDAYETGLANARDAGKVPNVRGSFAKMVVANEDGTPMFDQDADHTVLGETGCAVLDAIWEAGTAHNHYSDADRRKLEKNSEPTTAEDSSST